MKSCLHLILIFGFFSLAFQAHAQDENNDPEKVYYDIKLKDGQRLKGRVISSDKNNMQVVTMAGDTISILKLNIDYLRESEQEPKGLSSSKLEFFEDIRSSDYSRYFYSSPSFTIAENKVAAMTQGFSYSNITYGVTDNFSLEAGTSGTALLAALPIVAVTPKYRILNSKNTSVGIYSSFITTLPNVYDENANVVLFGVTTTIGNELKNVTFGVTGGLINGRLFELPLFQIGAANYLSPRTAIIFDGQLMSFGQLFGNDIGLLYNAMPGVRLMRRTFAIDLAIAVLGFTYDDQTGVIPLPYVGYNLYLSKK